MPRSSAETAAQTAWRSGHERDVPAHTSASCRARTSARRTADQRTGRPWRTSSEDERDRVAVDDVADARRAQDRVPDQRRAATLRPLGRTRRRRIERRHSMALLIARRDRVEPRQHTADRASAGVARRRGLRERPERIAALCRSRPARALHRERRAGEPARSTRTCVEVATAVRGAATPEIRSACRAARLDHGSPGGRAARRAAYAPPLLERDRSAARSTSTPGSAGQHVDAALAVRAGRRPRRRTACRRRRRPRSGRGRRRRTRASSPSRPSMTSSPPRPQITSSPRVPRRRSRARRAGDRARPRRGAELLDAHDRPQLALDVVRRERPPQQSWPSALPIAAMIMPWSSER